MAPTNNLSGSGIAFLTLSIVFLLLLILIWYRYLIWWRVLGRKLYEDRKGRGSRGGDHSTSPPSPRGRPQGTRRPRSPRSDVTNSSTVPWVPRMNAWQQGAQSQPETAETSTGSRDATGLASREEGRVEDPVNGRASPRRERATGGLEEVCDAPVDFEMSYHDGLPGRRQEDSLDQGRPGGWRPSRDGNAATQQDRCPRESSRGEGRGNPALFEPCNRQAQYSVSFA